MTNVDNSSLVKGGPSTTTSDIWISPSPHAITPRSKGQIHNNYQILSFFIKIQEIPYSHFQNGLLAKNNPRRVRRRLAQRLDPTRGAGGIEPGAWDCEPSSRPLGQICQSSQSWPGSPQDPKIMKIEMSTKSSKRGPHNLILGASCTELKGEQF